MFNSSHRSNLGRDFLAFVEAHITDQSKTCKKENKNLNIMDDSDPQEEMSQEQKFNSTTHQLSSWRQESR